ncbi:MAG: hypothetical protein ACPGWR_33910 [Ardenticatenaceae bacterium]
MSEQRAEYEAGVKTAIEQVPLNLGDCPECGHDLSIWKIELSPPSHFVMTLRCEACYYCALPRHIEFVPTEHLENRPP